MARGHLEPHDAKDMAAYAHGGGFSVDAGVRIEAADRPDWNACCATARGHRLPWIASNSGADLVDRCGKGHAEPQQSNKYGGELVLTPLELISRCPTYANLPAKHPEGKPPQ